ncbi:MAG: YaiI/YqxD family protein [Acidobacteriota bacterium]|nr:YaiI/YqxD family protein [Acidobacteriota bacterium]
MRILVDADACPVKEEIYRVAGRHRLEVTLVANSWMRVPAESWISLEVVGDGLDVADDWIAANAKAGDVVVTADIPLASRCLEIGAAVVGPNGRQFSEDNIGDVLATRDLLTELRSAGERTGGPAAFSKRDRSQFLQELDNAIHAMRRRATKRA